MGILDDLKHKREVKRLEREAQRKEELRLAPETGRIKAKAREDRIRKNARSPKKGGGIGGALMGLSKFGESASKEMRSYSTPAMDQMSTGFGYAPRRKSKRKKEEDPFAVWGY